jgi:hypothetical protein
MTTPDHIAAGTPSEFGQDLIKRRARIYRRSVFREDVASWSILATAIFVHCTAPEAQ